MVAMHLDPARFERFLCASRSGEDETLEQELEEAGVRTFALDRGSAANLVAWRALTRFVKKQRIDVIHAHKFGSNVWGSLLGTLTRVPVVVAHEHSWRYEGQPHRKFLDRHVVARLSDAFVAVSVEDKRRMMEVERIPASSIRFIPNGILTPPPSGHDARRELGIAPDAVVVGTVAQLRPEKALDLLVEAASIALPSLPGLRVVIVGDGREEHALRARVSELGLEDCVILAGHRSDVPDVLAAVDVTVCCSEFEGMPLSVLEYMAAAKPVIATNVGGLPAIVQHERTGLLVPPRDAAALAAAICRLGSDPVLRERFGRAGQASQRASFDFSSTVSAIQDLYVELFARTRRARVEGWVAPDEA